jgi:hypothetical protein
VIYRTLFQFSLNFFPTIFDVCRDDVTALQYAARPGITRTSIGSGKLTFRVIEVLMEYFSIGLDRDEAFLPSSSSDATFLTCANVVIGRVEPLIGMFIESRDENRFFGSFPVISKRYITFAKNVYSLAALSTQTRDRLPTLI